MKRIYKIYLPTLMILGLGSCSVEAPFQSEIREGYGQISKSAFELEVSGAQSTTTRADNSDILKDFNIVVQTTGSNPVTKYSEKYSDLPDIVTLPAGRYIVSATYGENQEAEFEKPHYLGVSDEFEVKDKEITTEIGKISCKLNNIKVSVNFHPTLVAHMDEKAFVEVKVNNGKSLNFTTEHSEKEVAGYFQHTGECTLVATFKGIVDGVELNEIKTLGSVDKGNHYKITFVRHEYNGEESGDVNGGINVDAKVTVIDYDRNITIAEDEILDDNERPKEEVEDPGKDPEDPDDPVTPDDPIESGDPQIVALVNPKTNNADIDLKKSNIVHSDSYVALKITCPGKFKVFTVDISENFDLEGILPNHLDLINPEEENIEAFVVLEIFKEGQKSLAGETEAMFNISDFMELLCNDSFGGQEYIFTIYVEDEEGNKACEELKIIPSIEG